MHAPQLTDNSWCKVCTLKLKKNNIKELALTCVSSSYLLKSGIKVETIPPSLDIERTLTVRDVERRGEEILVWFDGIDDANALQQYDSKICIVASQVASTLEILENSTFVGWTIERVGGEYLGTIKSVQEMPSQILVEVDTQSGRVSEIPIVDDFIICSDESAKRIVVDMPDYLALELV